MSKAPRIKSSAATQVEAAEAANTVPAPSAEIVNAANKTFTKVSEAGSVIVVRKLGPLQRMRLAEIIGAAAAQNPMYLGTATSAASVVSIDGDPVPFPASKRELEATVQRLDDDGIEAASAALAKLLKIEVDDEGNVFADGVLVKAKN